MTTKESKTTEARGMYLSIEEDDAKATGDLGTQIQEDVYTQIQEDDIYTEINEDKLSMETKGDNTQIQEDNLNTDMNDDYIYMGTLDDNGQNVGASTETEGERYVKMPLSHRGKRTHKRATSTICTGITCLEKGALVVVTHEGNFLVFDTKGIKIQEVYFGYRFEDITTISHSGVAASGEFFIKYFTLAGNDITEDKEREIDYSYDGEPTTHSVSSDTNVILVSCNVQTVDSNIKPFLRMFDLKGHVIRDIHLQSNNDIPTKADFCPKHKLIYVMDYRNKVIVCTSFDGQEKWRACFSSRPTDIKLLPDDMVAEVTENSHEISFFEHKTGHALEKIAELKSLELNGFLIDSDRKGHLFLCRIDNKSVADISVYPIEKPRRSETVMKKLTRQLSALH